MYLTITPIKLVNLIEDERQANATTVLESISFEEGVYYYNITGGGQKSHVLLSFLRHTITDERLTEQINMSFVSVICCVLYLGDNSLLLLSTFHIPTDNSARNKKKNKLYPRLFRKPNQLTLLEKKV